MSRSELAVRSLTEENQEIVGFAARCPVCGGARVSEFLSAPDRFHLRQQLYKLIRCSDCTCVWLASPPKPEEMGPHYDEDYHRVIAAGGQTSAARRWQRHRELIAKYKSGGVILDIGCSSGSFLGTMKGPSWKLHGIDMEASTAAQAQSLTGAEVFVGDAVEAPFAPGSFDVVTSFDLLEHVYQPREFLIKVFEWLKPGGIFYTVLPNIDSWESRVFRSYWYGLELPRHLFHFSPKSLRRLMTNVGFREVSLKTSSTCYIERSAGYVYSEVLERLGGSPVAQAKPTHQKFAWRAVRKVLRTTVVSPSGRVAALFGAGASMETVFTK